MEKDYPEKKNEIRRNITETIETVVKMWIHLPLKIKLPPTIPKIFPKYSDSSLPSFLWPIFRQLPKCLSLFLCDDGFHVNVSVTRKSIASNSFVLMESTTASSI